MRVKVRHVVMIVKVRVRGFPPLLCLVTEFMSLHPFTMSPSFLSLGLWEAFVVLFVCLYVFSTKGDDAA